jgi:hypothetical protein
MEGFGGAETLVKGFKGFAVGFVGPLSNFEGFEGFKDFCNSWGARGQQEGLQYNGEAA